MGKPSPNRPLPQPFIRRRCRLGQLHQKGSVAISLGKKKKKSKIKMDGLKIKPI
jgi:hypothetical protein